MSNVKTESGIQFLARIRNPKSSLWNLEDSLFIEGLKENDVVELTSENTYLKNVLLMHLLKQAILIDSFNGFQIGGQNCGVLLIDTAFHFNVIHFSDYLRKYLSTLNVMSCSESDKESIVEKLLENLIYIPCYNSQQLLTTFYDLHSTILSYPKIKLIVLDNVGANYWQDSVNGGLRRMDLYEKKIVSTLQNRVKDLKLPILYVRPEFFVSKHPSGCKMSNYRMSVSGTENGNVYKVQIETKMQQIEKRFIVSNGVLEWI